ncbi:hypothetical protein [Flavobacterium sp.]|uniref:hypothetical protein n=1 Tax=Flavobacterium sp. TaxID=239 RepID=UPI002B4AF33C|nr:hypothetical protein [Flavobacterium sp.]HLP63969.1 hypothetical protein [Flavobacterium sp.]
MKNRFKNYLTVVALIFTFLAVAQAPQKMSYQSVIRNNTGDLVANSPIGLRISILKDSPTGTVVYSETMTNTTNENGLLSIEIGGGTPIIGTFAGIDWSTGTFFIKTETDPNGGSNYDVVGTSQLLSVPYALYAAKSKNLGKTSIYISEDATQAEVDAQIAEEAGPNTENIYIQNNPNITTLDLSALKTMTRVEIYNNSSLTSINLGNLTKVYETILIGNNPVLSTINFDSLSYIGTYMAMDNNDALTNINFPSLTRIGKDFNGSFSLGFMPNLVSVNFPVLTQIIGVEFNISYNNLLTSIEMPALTSAKQSVIAIKQNAILPDISLGLLQFYNIPIIITENPLLTNIMLANQTSTEMNVSNGYDFSGNALPSNQVNSILSKFIPFEPLSSYVQIDLNQNPPAPPTGQGIIDKQTLINNGFNVFTD